MTTKKSKPQNRDVAVQHDDRDMTPVTRQDLVEVAAAIRASVVAAVFKDLARSRLRIG